MRVERLCVELRCVMQPPIGILHGFYFSFAFERASVVAIKYTRIDVKLCYKCLILLIKIGLKWDEKDVEFHCYAS